MAKGDWPKSFWIPSVALSTACVGFLVWREHDPSKVDGYTLALFAVGFAPWFLPGLQRLLESVAFPGGWLVKFRVDKVEDEQKRQAGDIEGLHFLLGRLITEGQRELLQRLVSDDAVGIDHFDGGRLNEQLRSLHRFALIATKPSFVALTDELRKSGESHEISTINEMYDVTDGGRKYLELTADLPDTARGPIDPYRPQ